MFQPLANSLPAVSTKLSCKAQMKEGLSEHMFNGRITSELQHFQNFKKCDHFVTLATSAMRSAKTWCFQNLWIKTTVLATDRSSITMTDIVLAMVTDVSTHTVPCHAIFYHTIPCHAIPCHTIPYHANGDGCISPYLPPAIVGDSDRTPHRQASDETPETFPCIL